MSPRLPPGAHLVERARVGSTNAVARELAAAGAAAPTFVWAREQTAGRGRRGAGWVSPPGNLYVSTILRPACPAVTAMQLGFATAVAVAEAIETAGDLSAHVKWPNDVLLDARKVCGILLESSAAATGTLDWLVIGTGINVAHRPADLPEAASLADAGCEVAVDQLLEVYAERLLHWVARWSGEGFGPVRDAWLARATGLGEAIRVRLPDHELSGVFADLDPSGALLLERRGEQVRVSVGEVFPAAV